MNFCTNYLYDTMPQMSLKSIEVLDRGGKYRSQITETVSTVEVLQILAGGRRGDYFFGGVFESDGEEIVCFGTGPNHHLFRQAVVEEYGMSPDTHARIAQVCTGCRGSNEITGIVFTWDPAKGRDYVTPDENDPSTHKTRRTMMRAIANRLSPDICHDRIFIGWLEGDIEYSYLPKAGMLRRNIQD